MLGADHRFILLFMCNLYSNTLSAWEMAKHFEMRIEQLQEEVQLLRKELDIVKENNTTYHEEIENLDRQDRGLQRQDPEGSEES
ncbi:MAG: hypothetical protein LC655_07805 [Bacteroidales bacterium]|nr:hypothetical protein [Bacteroidales bacterium]